MMSNNNGPSFPNPQYMPNFGNPQPTPEYRPMGNPNVFPNTFNPQPYTTQYTPNPPMTQNIPGIRGRIISDPASVAPSEVPMDGQRSIFPTQDGNRIFVKWWDSTGTLQTATFVREETEGEMTKDIFDPKAAFQTLEESVNEKFDEVGGYFDEIMSKLSSMSKTANRKETTEK